VQEDSSETPIKVFVGLAAQILILAGGLYLSTIFPSLKMDLLAMFLLFLMVMFVIMRSYPFKNRMQTFGIFGLLISTGLITFLLTMKYYLFELHVTALHIGIILLVPQLPSIYLQIKEKGM